jgi:hypothetical protein
MIDIYVFKVTFQIFKEIRTYNPLAKCLRLKLKIMFCYLNGIYYVNMLNRFHQNYKKCSYLLCTSIVFRIKY